MAKKKKSKSQPKFPKRIAGVKVPRGFRRFASTPLGGAIIAESLMQGARTLARNQRVQHTADKVGHEAGELGSASIHLIANAVRTALAPFYAAGQRLTNAHDDASFNAHPANYRGNGSGIDERAYRKGPFAPNEHPGEQPA